MFDPSNDLSTVADNTEAVTLLRRGSTPGSAGTPIAHALRRAVTIDEASIVTTADVQKRVPSDGKLLAYSLVWHLPVVELPDAPQLGNVILDGDGVRWTVMTVKLATLGVRWQCGVKDVTIAGGWNSTISVQKNNGAAGSPVWQTQQSGIPARIQPLKVVFDTTAATPTTTTTSRIFVGENIDLDHTCRIVGEDGTVYGIISMTGMDRIGEIQVIEVETVAS
jgi:hypothetical protein